MTKFALTAVLFFALATITYGQNKVEKYCEVTSSNAFLSPKIVATISFGQENPQSTDTAASEIIKFIQSNKFESRVDILNYMSSKGWTLKSSCAYEDVTNGSSLGSIIVLYFGKIIENN